MKNLLFLFIDTFNTKNRKLIIYYQYNKISVYIVYYNIQDIVLPKENVRFFMRISYTHNLSKQILHLT